MIIAESGEGAMSFSCSLRTGGRRDGGCKGARPIEFSYHIEVRTLNARRMFRE